MGLIGGLDLCSILAGQQAGIVVGYGLWDGVGADIVEPKQVLDQQVRFAGGRRRARGLEPEGTGIQVRLAGVKRPLKGGIGSLSLRKASANPLLLASSQSVIEASTLLSAYQAFRTSPTAKGLSSTS